MSIEIPLSQALTVEQAIAAANAAKISAQQALADAAVGQQRLHLGEQVGRVDTAEGPRLGLGPGGDGIARRGHEAHRGEEDGADESLHETIITQVD